MLKRIFNLLFIVILIVVAILNFTLIYTKYSNKEKIVAQIYHVDKQLYEYDYVDSDNPRIHYTKKGHKYIVYYSFNYNGEEKTDNFEGNNILYKQGRNLTIYYDKITDTSIAFIFPITFVYIIILVLIYLVCYILCYTKKINISILGEYPNPPLFIQFIIIGMCYLAYRVDNIGGFFLSFIFMIISIAIAVQAYIIVHKQKSKVEKVFGE